MSAVEGFTPTSGVRLGTVEARGECKLVVLSEEHTGQQFVLSGSYLSMGRLESNDICLPWDARVSRRHARLYKLNGGWLIEDAGSTNGTFLGEERINDPVALAPGSRIRVGRIWLEVQGEEQEPMEDKASAVVEEIAPPVEEEMPELAAAEYLEPVLVVDEPSADDNLLALQEVEQVAPEVVARPGILARLLAPFQRKARVAVEEHQETAPAVVSEAGHDTGELSCQTAAPLALEIRAVSADPDGAPDIDEIKRILTSLEPPQDVVVQVMETLGSADARAVVSASSGAQGDLLIYAGKIVDALSLMPAYTEVLVNPVKPRQLRE